MNKLSVDIGNSSAKVAVFNNREIIYYERFGQLDVHQLTEIIETYNPQKSVVSTVSQQINHLEVILKNQTEYIRFSTALTTNVSNRYNTPETLGLDRWAAILGANVLAGENAILVIDAGTCITYDLLTSTKEYFGGSISPGILMRFRAVHEFTGRLPLVEWDREAEIPEGRDTATAIKQGVLQGIINEIEGFIAKNNRKERRLKVIITGGDANFLHKQLQNSIFAPQIVNDPYLVLKGLNEAIAD